MVKRTALFFLAAMMSLMMSTTAFADDQKDFIVDSIDIEQSTAFAEIEGATGDNLLADVEHISHDMLIKTGEPIALKVERTGSILDGTVGQVSGALTESNPFDFHVISSSTPFYGIFKIETQNTNYTLTLAVIDWDAGTITPTELAVSANEMFIATFEAGEYTWLVESSGTYDIEYMLQYNTTVPVGGNPVYVSGDVQKIYSCSNDKLKINNVTQNIDYKVDVDWDVVVNGESRWQKLHVWMEDPNVSVVHVGGARLKAGITYPSYPNAIVLQLKTGGLFTHYFNQNPPYINLGYKDMWGVTTPRTIDYNDLSQRGAHYLVYDTDTDSAVEFVSGLSKEWSQYGDKSDFRIF